LSAITGSLPTVADPPKLDDYKWKALTREGDVARGKALFNDEQKVGCTKCHTIDGSAGKAGPDLVALGDKFGRRDIVQAILQPSATIAPGYTTLIVETKAGAEIQGILKQSNAEGIQVMGGDGKLVAIAKDDIKEQRASATSLMPEGLQAALSLDEFSDLVEYLTTLKQPESTLAGVRGMPSDLPMLAKPVVSLPFFAQRFAIPRERVETGLTSMRQIPGQPGVFLVLHQKGLIWRAEKHGGGEDRAMFSDLTHEVFSEHGPNGLLDVAFHPKFLENRKYYLFHQVFEEGKVATHIVEKEFDAAFRGDSGRPGRVIIKFFSVADDHSGGCLAFGRDGFLYLVMGDTGPHNDPNGHAQNLQLLLGKLLRIDVDHQENGNGYAIPSDNPFRGRADARPEIWAYGLRNPWRFSFDKLTGELWLADVGQDRVEEIDIVRGGENFGWNVYEGFEPFSNQYKKDDRTFVMPLFAYRRKYGASITGGHVYRGDKTSSFYGVYVFGDYVSKRMYGLTRANGALGAVREIGAIPERLVSFSEDEAGDLYAIGFEGTIYKLDFTEARFE
jgi:putative heme-binding domain-containing protein